jgi:hypothetical protein
MYGVEDLDPEKPENIIADRIKKRRNNEILGAYAVQQTEFTMEHLKALMKQLEALPKPMGIVMVPSIFSYGAYDLIQVDVKFLINKLAEWRKDCPEVFKK